MSGVGRSTGAWVTGLGNHLTFGLVSFLTYNLLIHWLRRKFWPGSLIEPEPWSEWLRLQRPIIVFNPGRPALYRSTSPVLEPRVRSLIRELGVKEHTLALHNDFGFLWELPVWTHGKAQEHQRRHCPRCRIVQGFGLSKLKRRLALRPCSRCGFNGDDSGAKSSEANPCCSICLEVYSPKSQVVGLPCGHEYHRRCVFAWLLSDPHQTCPCCRQPAYKTLA